MTSQSQTNSAFLSPQDAWGQYNQLAFVIRQELAKLQTATVVQVVSCTNAGGLSPVGFVDVQPLVAQVDGDGKPTPHGIIPNVPYFRIQGGSNAVIIDPQPGDIGIAVFASRDISSVKRTKSAALPGSLRMHDYSDGLYIGGVLNGVPTQYVQFSAAGVSIVSPTAVMITAPNVIVTGNVAIHGNLAQDTGNATMTGSLTTQGDVKAGNISLQNHVHGGVQPGGGTTGAPQ